MSPVAVTKMHGTLNDFVILDRRESKVDDLASFARTVCDRRGGIGADGVIVLESSDIADARMRVINADGSEAEMCGNGLRCVVKYLHDRDASLAKPALTIDTGAGPLRCTIDASGITVDMGRPRLTRGEVPMTGPAGERCIEQPIELGGPRAVTGVSMGNPHAVIFTDDTNVRALAQRLGAELEAHAWFPRHTNAEFAHVRGPREIDLAVWERGVNAVTYACGTGACATVVAACLTGRATAGDTVTVHLPGGDLAITVAADLSTVHMRGPAVHVFDGELT